MKKQTYLIKIFEFFSTFLISDFLKSLGNREIGKTFSFYTSIKKIAKNLFVS
jgi:hypothetical protein